MMTKYVVRKAGTPIQRLVHAESPHKAKMAVAFDVEGSFDMAVLALDAYSCTTDTTRDKLVQDLIELANKLSKKDKDLLRNLAEPGMMDSQTTLAQIFLGLLNKLEFTEEQAAVVAKYFQEYGVTHTNVETDEVGDAKTLWDFFSDNPADKNANASAPGFLPDQILHLRNSPENMVKFLAPLPHDNRESVVWDSKRKKIQIVGNVNLVETKKAFCFDKVHAYVKTVGPVSSGDFKQIKFFDPEFANTVRFVLSLPHHSYTNKVDEISPGSGGRLMIHSNGIVLSAEDTLENYVSACVANRDKSKETVVLRP